MPLPEVVVSEKNKITYNNFEFVNQRGVWLLEDGDFNFVFKHNPRETNNVCKSQFFL